MQPDVFCKYRAAGGSDIDWLSLTDNKHATLRYAENKIIFKARVFLGRYAAWTGK